MPQPAPVAPGEIFIPKMFGAPVANTPECAEWTRTAGPDETVLITGNNFSKYTTAGTGKDSKFRLFATSADTNAIIQRIDSDKAIITISNKIPAWSMYLVWPGNENGYGSPVAINKTDAWWTGPSTCTRNAVVSVFGRNLAHSNDTVSSNVYIKPANGSGEWATVTKVNPYKVDFIVPPDLANGDYEVWVHNGHGGNYGWSGPLNLTVIDNYKWNPFIFNVKRYGVTGDGSTDDFQRIKTVINAASLYPGSIVYFPSGEYLISNTIFVSSNLTITGDGSQNSIIKCNSDFSAASSGMICGGVNNFVISNIGLNTNRNFRGEHTAPLFLRGSTNTRVQNVEIFCPGFDVMNLDKCVNISLNNCDITGKISFLGSASQIFIDSCDFKLTDDAENAVHSWGGEGICITNCTCRDYDNSDPNNGAGWGKGRFFIAAGNAGSTRYTYIGNNRTENLAVRPDPSVDQNSGEQFLWEGFSTDWMGSVQTSNQSVTTLKDFYTVYSDAHFVTIVQGRGLGQTRKIIGYNNPSITLDAAWNVIPDTSSIIVIGHFADRIVMYKNFIDGKSYSVTNVALNGSAGIEPYGAISNFIAANNTIQEVRWGIANWETQIKTGLDPNFFNLFANNKILTCRWGMLSALYNTKSAGKGMMGTSFRNNIVNNSDQSGIAHLAYSPDSSVADAIMYEHNTFNNVLNGLTTGGDAGLPLGYALDGHNIINTVLYKNAFVGSQTPNNFGIKKTANMALQKNAYSKFDAVYANGLPDIAIEAPYHVTELSGISDGSIVQSNFTLWNSGTSAFQFTLSPGANWLSLSPAGGAIADENDSSIIILHADPSGLSQGNYTTDINVTTGTQNKVYQVLFKVAAPPVDTLTLNGKRDSSNVTLNWQFTTRSNDLGFDIERSLEENDNFTKIGFVPVVAGTGDTNYYKFQDINAPSQQVYYRLKHWNTRNAFFVSTVLPIASNVVDTVPAPVDTLILNGKRDGINVVLNWQFTTRSNDLGFDIERSLQENDNFTKIGFVPVVAGTGDTNYYQFQDINAPSQQVYYRLKHWNTQNAFFVSNVLPIVSATVDTVPAPVDTLTLNGKRDGINVVLNWQFTTRSTDLGFDIERSLEENDNFSKIGFAPVVAGTGNTNYYLYQDINAPTQQVYYRLKHWNTQNAFFVSSVLPIVKLIVDTIPVQVDTLTLFGKRNGNNVALNWQSTTRSNDLGFDIERSLKENEDFSKIGFVQAATGAVDTNYYQFQDANPPPQKIYYRLKQWSIQNTFFDSNVLSIATSIKNNSFSIYPNPAPGILHVNFKIADTGQVVLMIFDVKGTQILKQLSFNAAVGLSSKDLDTTSLAKGIYLIKTRFPDNSVQTIRFVKG